MTAPTITPAATESVCTCFETAPSTWFVHYGAVEPGSMMEPNPDCPVHSPP